MLETSSDKERTLNKQVQFTGRGLHTGKLCTVTLKPAPARSGVIFRRIDLGGSEIPATISYAQKYIRCSGLKRNDVSIRTCEHLLAALYGCQIDNVLVELNQEEVPILDGSAAPLVAVIQEGGFIEQEENRRIIQVQKTLESRDGERFVRIEPAYDLSINLSLTLNRFPKLSWSGSLSPNNFCKEIAAARTFSPLHHALPMKIISLLSGLPIARGATLNNLLLFSMGKVINPGGLRLDNEFARHRVLDIVGDLALADMPVHGKITAFRSSHSLNQDLVAQLITEH